MTVGDNVVTFRFYIVNQDLETLLSGKACEDLGFITFNPKPTDEALIRKVNCTTNPAVKKIIDQYTSVFTGVGTLKDHQVNMLMTLYLQLHLQLDQCHSIFEIVFRMKLRTAGIIEEHSGPAPWISNPVIAPKENGEIRITADMRNPNKAIQDTHLPIPRAEDIRAELSGICVFSKLDFRSAFHQLELEEESRHLTVIIY